jgi:hypothetical protein
MDVFSMESNLRLYNESDFAAETELENLVEFRSWQSKELDCAKKALHVL